MVTNDPNTPKLPKVPDLIPNSPVLNSFLRNTVLAAAVGIAGTITGFLNAKGFNTAWVEPYLPYLIGLALVAVATFIWSLVTSNQKAAQIVDLVEHVLEAAQSGQVPAAVQQVATPAQKTAAFAINTAPASKPGG